MLKTITDRSRSDAIMIFLRSEPVDEDAGDEADDEARDRGRHEHQADGQRRTRSAGRRGCRRRGRSATSRSSRRAGPVQRNRKSRFRKTANIEGGGPVGAAAAVCSSVIRRTAVDRVPRTIRALTAAPRPGPAECSQHGIGGAGRRCEPRPGQGGGSGMSMPSRSEQLPLQPEVLLARSEADPAVAAVAAQRAVGGDDPVARDRRCRSGSGRPHRPTARAAPGRSTARAI